MSTRIYGAALYLTIEGTDHAADIISTELEFEDADTDGLTFGEAMDIADKGKLKLSAIQSTDATGFWATVWDAAGTKAVPFVLAVHGNAVPTAEQPHVTGTVDIGVRPKLGGSADPKKSYQFDVEWDAKVDRDLKTTAA